MNTASAQRLMIHILTHDRGQQWTVMMCRYLPQRVLWDNVISIRLSFVLRPGRFCNLRTEDCEAEVRLVLGSEV